jgi:hypothetical protein
MKPFIHAMSSAKKLGGQWEEYVDIHDFLDSSKSHIADHRHRAIFHHSLGCFIVEQLFGKMRINSVGKHYSPRDLAEQHIIEDLGTIPTVQDWLQMELEPWMGGVGRVPINKDELKESAKESVRSIHPHINDEEIFYDKKLTHNDDDKKEGKLDREAITKIFLDKKLTPKKRRPILNDGLID